MILFGFSASLLGLALWLLRISDRRLDEAKAILERAVANNDSAQTAVDRITTQVYDFREWAEQFKGGQQ